MIALPVGERGSTVTVGSFDGVHRGHQAVLAEVARRAQAAGRASALVTFEPHPLEVVRPERAPQLLTTYEERLEALAETPLDYVLVERFDRALARYSPERFVREILVGRCGMRELVIGHDHGFGRDRAGSVETLRALGASDGFSVDVVAPVGAATAPVSSTAIRRAVATGALDEAAALLGRRYTLSGRVVAGERRGRLLGVPTINLVPPPRKQLPPDGVYAVRVEWAGGRTGGMMNQGGKPTFGDEARTLEAHLFGVDAALYGAWVRLEWVARLRETRRFGSAEELVRQLAQDRADAERALAAT